MEKIKVVLLVLVVQSVCGNPVSETEREAAETTALKENLKRQLKDGEHRMMDLYTSFFFTKSDAADYYGTYAQNTELCEGLGGGPITINSQGKLDLFTQVNIGATKSYRWLGTKRDSYGRWLWSTGEDIEPSNLEWDPEEADTEGCIEVDLPGPLSRYGCGKNSGFACEVEGKRSKPALVPSRYVVKNIKTRLIVVLDPSKNYEEAKAACESEGIGSGRLATPSSFRELDAIDELLRKFSEETGGQGRSDRGYWLGAKRNYRDAPTWNTGFKIVGNLRQFVAENGGKCLLYVAIDGFGKFDWVNCGDSHFSGYVCQIDKEDHER